MGVIPARQTGPSISASVGLGAANRSQDVRTIQVLLNRAGAELKEDGDCGRKTISAIRDFQTNWTRNADARVDPGGVTWTRLLQGKLKVKRNGYIVLPQDGADYYSYSPTTRQYGTHVTVRSLLAVSKKFHDTYPDVLIGIGDMSYANGAEMTPHKTHRNGRNADIRPVRTDGKKLPVTISDQEYSREYTEALVKLLRADPNLRSILFNDSEIDGVTNWEGHHNHLHVSMKE